MNIGIAGWLKFAGMALVLGATVAPATGQDFPSKTIRMIVVAPAGGTADNVARNLAKHLGDRLGQQVVVDNRPSNAGIVGYEMAARSAPDGYTLVMATGTLSTVASLFPNITFDPIKDFEPISWVLTTPYVVTANPALPVNTFGELIAHAKANPGKVSYAGGTVGAQQHLAGELIRRNFGVDMLYVPYKGSGPMMPDLLGGRLDVAIDNVLLLAPHVKRGAIRGLAVTGETRSPALPDLPTVAESGSPGFNVIGWFGVFAPAGTPQPIIRRLNAEMAGVMKMKEVADPLLAQGAEPQSGTPDDLRKLLAREIALWSKIIKEAGIKPQ